MERNEADWHPLCGLVTNYLPPHPEGMREIAGWIKAGQQETYAAFISRS